MPSRKRKRKKEKKAHPLQTYFPRRWKKFHTAILAKDTTRGKIYKRGIRRLIAWRMAYPDKEMPDTCVYWTEAQFRIWSGQEEIIEEKKTEEIDLDSMEDSLLECPQCHSRKVDHFGKQTRSADEPETIFAHCLACGHRWRQ